MPNSWGANPYGKPSKTLRGELVKSLGEKQIADFFFQNRIKYNYEHQVDTSVSAFKDKISKPDFYLPDYSVHVEYWGLVDAADRETRQNYEKEMHWKKEEYKRNGIKLISLYPWNLNDLEGSFKAEFRKILGKDFVAGPVGERSIHALPLHEQFNQFLQKGIPGKLESEKVDLVYHPYFFVEYDCFTQGNFFYERVNLASRGVLVLEGTKGALADIALISGESPRIQRNGNFIGCAKIGQRTVLKSQIEKIGSFSKIDATAAKLTKTDAEKITKVEIAKHLEKTFNKALKNRVETKTLRPYESQVRIASVNLLHIPLVTGTFRYKNRMYRRMIQATTCRIIGDDFAHCNVDQATHSAGSVALCEECGSLACKDHRRQCEECEETYCKEHILSKGLMLKKYYCATHCPK